jgi:N-methylhydantoinase B
MANNTWAALENGEQTAFPLLDGSNVGGPGRFDKDGTDANNTPVGFPSPPTSADVEVMELFYPILVTERGLRQGVNGAGEHHSGGGAVFAMGPYGTDRLVGQMLGIREWLPLPGLAGGSPGSTTEFLVHRADGSVERVSSIAADVVIQPGETFELRCPSAGGFGDPLDRAPGAVADDVAEEWYAAEEAAAVYGVVLDPSGVPDLAATDERRAALRADRLRRATPAVRELTVDDVAGKDEGETMPFTPGVVQHGSVAYAEASGAPLAIAPDPWTDGCPVIEESLGGPGPRLVRREYLDPRTGQALHVEVVPEGEPISFAIEPARWTKAAALA